MHLVTSADFIDQLRSNGCKIVFYVEYVPIDPRHGASGFCRRTSGLDGDFAGTATQRVCRHHLSLFPRRRESPWRLPRLRTRLFPHRSRWFGRTLPLLAFQRQQCGGDGSARSLEVPPCSARFVLPRHSDGSIQADVHCLNIVRKSKKWSYNQSLKSI